MIKHISILMVVLLLTACAKPVALFTYDSQDNKAPTKVRFKNASEKAETYEWDFGDGTTSTEVNPEHSYFLSGNYTIKLVARKGKKENIMTKDVYIEAPHNCTVQMETTMGNLTIVLYDDTPKHRDNFIKLAETGYYDGILFHRVIDGFMIQGGDPNSKGAEKGTRLGSGGPGYQIKAEFTEKHAHVKGALSAARMGDAANPEKKSSGSQFYIVQGKPVSEGEIASMERRKGITYSDEIKEKYTSDGGTPFLDQEYTVYGQVIEGLDIIDKIAKSATDRSDRPVEDIKILKVRVVK